MAYRWINYYCYYCCCILFKLLFLPSVYNRVLVVSSYITTYTLSSSSSSSYTCISRSHSCITRRSTRNSDSNGNSNSWCSSTGCTRRCMTGRCSHNRNTLRRTLTLYDASSSLPSTGDSSNISNTDTNNRSSIVSSITTGAASASAESNNVVVVTSSYQEQFDNFVQKLNNEDEIDRNVNNHEDDDERDNEILMACIAYLQRHNLLKGSEEGETSSSTIGWIQKKRRQQMRLQSEGRSGYFWDRPQELKYLRKNSISKSKEEEMDFLREIDDEHVDMEVKSSNFRNIGNEGNNDDDNEYEASTTLSYNNGGKSYGFLTFPSGPGSEHINRSRAAKKKWEDPMYRKKWYTARWGENYESNARKKMLQERVDSIVPEILTSLELKSMTPSEITSALKTYIISNKKRSLSHKINRERRKNRTHKKSMIAGNKKLTFTPNDHDLANLREKRAEKSRRAYQTRLISSQQKKSKSELSEEKSRPKVPHEVEGWESSSAHAAFRIEISLNNEEDPQVRDIQLMMKAKRLPKRRKLYQRIIKERFNLYGKCVDVEGNESIYYPSHCDIHSLGKFVCRELSARNS